MKKRIIAIIMLIMLSLQSISCSSKTETDSLDSLAGDKPADSYYDYNASGYDSEYPSLDKTENTSTSSTNNDLEERKIIKNANISFETKEYDEFMKGLYSLIELNGGYIQSQDSRGSGAYDTYSLRYSSLTVRIPETYYSEFIGVVGSLGSMTRINEYQNDVTMSYIDTESHIKALQAEYDALINILTESTNINDIITVQSRISDINYQLDSLKSQLRKYDDLIAYCTINITVNEVKRETPNTNQMTFGERIASGLKETFADIGEDLSEFTVWFVVSLPYIVIWVIIIGGIILIISSMVKSKKRKNRINKQEISPESYSDGKKKD